MTRNYFSLYSFDKPHSSGTWPTLITVFALASGLLLWKLCFVRASPAPITVDSEPAAPVVALTVLPSAKLPEIVVDASLATTINPQQHRVKTQHPPKLVALPDVPGFSSYVLIFEGQATCTGQPVRDAQIQIRLTSLRESGTFETATGPDGRFTMRTHFKGAPNEAVDWTLDAKANDYQSIQVEGRKIITTDSETITTVQQHLDFLTI